MSELLPLPTSKDVPFYKSEQCFRQYEELIRQAIAIAPSRLVIPPIYNKSTETLRARLRDAFKYLRAHPETVLKTNQLGQSIDKAKFDEYAPFVAVCADPINPYNTIVKFRPKFIEPEVKAETAITYTGSDQELIRALLLLRKNAVIGPVLLTLVTEELLADLKEGEKSGEYGLSMSDQGVFIV